MFIIYNYKAIVNPFPEKKSDSAASSKKQKYLYNFAEKKNVSNSNTFSVYRYCFVLFTVGEIFSGESRFGVIKLH